MITKFLKGKPASFHEVYPTVKSLQLIGVQEGNLGRESLKNINYTESSIPAMIKCGNLRCQQGGYEIQNLLDTLVLSQETLFEETYYCKGHEGSPKGRRKDESCMNSIKFTLQIQYHSTSST